jgi:hypothetical protein
MNVCNYTCTLDHCKGHRTYKTLTSNETVEIPVTSTCLSVVYPNSKTDRMHNRLLHIESVERYIHVRHMQVIMGCCYIYMGSWQWQNWNHPVFHTVVSFPPASMFNKISKYKAEVDDSVVSLISSSLGYMESTYGWNGSLLIDISKWWFEGHSKWFILLMYMFLNEFCFIKI